MADKWWEAAPVVDQQAPQQPSGGGVILSDPNSGLDAEGKRVGIDSTIAGDDRAETSQAQSLRQEFIKLPEVTRYASALGSLDTALRTAPDGNGDSTLLYAYSKLMDPDGAVREGDVALAQSGSSYLNAKAAQLMKEFGIEGGGSLPQDVRDGLRREMINRTGSYQQAYNQKYGYYGKLAEGAGYTPFEVVGDHAGQPFRERFRAYDERGKPTGPVSLPRAVGAHDQGGMGADGVAPKGSGYRVEPALYHLGNTVADMISKGADAPQIREYLDKEYAPYGVSTSTPMIAKINEVIQAHKAAPNKPIKSLVPGWDNLHMVPEDSGPSVIGQVADSPVGAGMLGLADIATLGFGDEIAGLVAGDNYNAALDYAKEERPYSYTAGQIAGSLLLPTGAETAGLKAGTTALRSGEGMAAARIAASKAATSRLAKEAGAYGTVHGFGSGEGGIEDRLASAGIEGTLGFAGVKAGGKVLNRVQAGRAARADLAGADSGSEYLAAAERQGVTPFVGDVSTPAAAATGKLAQTQAGVGPVTRAAKETYNTTAAARDRLAQAIGSPMDGEALGYRLSEGARKAIALARDNAQAFYKTAERQSEGLRIKPAQAYQTVSDEIDKIADTGLGDKALTIFRRVQDRMTQGPMSVETLRNIRTQLREDLATEGIRGGKADAAARRVMEAITKDVDTALRTNGMEGAADAFKKGDELWAAYTELTDKVIAPIIGKEGELSGEAVVKRLQADLRGNNARAAHFLRALPAEEQQLARSSIVQSLGRARDGSFSFGEFVKNWADIGDSAKEAYFGADLRAALNDLDTVARGAKQSQRWYNHSNTGGALNAPIETTAGIATLGSSLLLTNISARLLTSKAAVRWLASAAKKPNPEALSAHVKRLSGLAEAEPAIANEVLNLQQRLTEQLSGGASRTPLPAYAEEEGDSVKAKPAKGKSGDAQ